MPSKFSQTELLGAHVINDVQGFVQEFYVCTILANVPQSHINSLLSIMTKFGFPVYKTARAAQKTPREVEIKNRAGGKYIYFGIENSIIPLLNSDDHVPQNLSLSFNIDGAQMPFTPNETMWPILCYIKRSAFRPLLVCLFTARKKPDPIEEFMEDFLRELSHLLSNGIVIDGNIINITLHSFVCDAPARASIKGIKYHSGFYSCERCTIHGEKLDTGHMVFIREGTELARTDHEFASFKYSGVDDQGKRNHQQYLREISKLVPCVSGFVLDSMHMIFLGVTKRVIQFWLSGPRCCLLSAQQQKIISSRLLSFRGKLPDEFSRQPSPLDRLDAWKATDFRIFLLYIGPIILRDVLNEDLYRHFISLHLAIYILSDEDYASRVPFLPFARDLLQFFVSESENLYSKAFVSFNVHCLLHLTDDVEHYEESLTSLSAFKFESFIGYIRQKIRGPKSPIVQVAKRIEELNNIKEFPLLHKATPTASIELPNSCFFVSDSQLLFLTSLENNEFTGKIVNSTMLTDMYRCNIDSTQFKIGIVERDAIRKAKFQTYNNISHFVKAVCLSYDDKLYVIPMLHER